LSINPEVSESELKALQESAKKVLDEYVRAGKIRYVEGSVPVLVYGVTPELPSFREPRAKNLELTLKQYGDFFSRGEGIMFTPFGAYIGKPDVLGEAAAKAGLIGRAGYNRAEILYGENPTQIALVSKGLLTIVYRTTLSKEDIIGIRKNLELVRDSVRSADARKLLVRALALLHPLDTAPYYEGLGFEALHIDPNVLEKNKQEFVKVLSEAMKYVDDPRLIEMLRDAMNKIQSLRIAGVTYRVASVSAPTPVPTPVAPSRAETATRQPATQQRMPELPKLYPPRKQAEERTRARRRRRTILQTL